jgi:hypothetical protein
MIGEVLMTTPVTTLDQRYSDTDARATGWEETRRLLETAELSWISTVRADGRPHVTPLVAVWVDDALYFHTGAEEQKFANLNANPHVVLTTGCSRWDEGIDGRFCNRNAGDWPSEVFGVEPAKVFAHAKGEPFGATTHKF